MRDPVLEESLRRLAGEAATRFTSLIAGGAQVPFDVTEADGDNSLFYRYVPLTSRFVEAHADELRSLPAFGSACGAVNMKGAAAPYLEHRGESVPGDPDERAARMLVRFISELWEGCSEFTLDRYRLDEALETLEAQIRDVHDAELLVAPLVGLQMVPPAIELPSNVRIVRADTVDAPIEAMRSEGMGREAWQPQFLALTEIGSEGDAVAEAVDRLHLTITTLRLFKSGEIGLGPFAFAPTAEDSWKRVATGAAPPRPGQFELDDVEVARLLEMAGWITPRLRAAKGSLAPGPLNWSLRRFELGRERPDAVEALTDHLLSLRSILEGDGPVGAPLPVRAAALFVDGHEHREQARTRIEEALKLEKSLMSGGTVVASDQAAGLATWFEDSVRAVLLDSVAGALGDNAGMAADESLLSAGLDEGEGSLSQRGDTEEWESLREPDFMRRSAAGHDQEPIEIRGATVPDQEGFVEEFDSSVRRDYDDGREEITRIMEPVPSDDSEIRITAMVDEPHAGAEHDLPADEEEEIRIRSDWLSEVSGSDRSTKEWPAESGRASRPVGASRRESSREFDRPRIDSPRVRHLFPVPEDADWSIGELDYDRRRRSA